MANQKQLSNQKKNLSVFGVALTKRLTIGLLAGLVVVVIAVLVVQNQIATQQQQQRFDSLRPVMQSFETNVKGILGSSLTDIKEYDSCYHLAQTETPVPGTNGILYCGIEIQGATDELSNAKTQGAWATMLLINKAVNDAVAKSGMAVISTGFDANTPGRDDAVDYGNSFYLYGQIVRCDLQGTKPAIDSSQRIVNVGTDQIYFDFGCQQQASKDFFKFIPSPLD